MLHIYYLEYWLYFSLVISFILSWRVYRGYFCFKKSLLRSVITLYFRAVLKIFSWEIFRGDLWKLSFYVVKENKRQIV